jgi:hypothetical protein
VIAKHAIVTDECRRNRSDIAAGHVAVQRLMEEYIACVSHWPIGKGHKFHFKLEIERGPEEESREQAS